jgi:hypothetical protein
VDRQGILRHRGFIGLGGYRMFYYAAKGTPLVDKKPDELKSWVWNECTRKMLLFGNQGGLDDVVSASQPTLEWRRLDLRDEAATGAVRWAIARICQQDPRATLEHDMGWLLGNHSSADTAPAGNSLDVWLCYQGTAVVGYAPVTVSPARLRPSIGELVMSSWRIQRHTLVGCPLFADSARGDEEWLTLSLLDLIRRTLPPDGVLFVLGARGGSGLFSLLRDRSVGARFLIADYGPRYHRRLVRLFDTFDEYVAGLSKKTRMNLRRYEKKLQRATNGKMRVVRYVTMDDVDRFLDAAVPLSAKTYQWKRLELGLHDRARHARQLKVAAENDWMLCYIMFHGDAPIAFQVGYRYRDTYFTHETGYDPDWAGFWVGNQLDMAIVRDQIEHHPETKWIDFLYGDSFNKNRFSNAARIEQNCYLFPRTCRGVILFTSLKAASFISEGAGRLLDRFGMKKKLRRLLWQS